MFYMLYENNLTKRVIRTRKITSSFSDKHALALKYRGKLDFFARLD
jgi:hypothetical protein